MAKATTQASKQPAANSRDQRLKMMLVMQNNIEAGAGAGELPGVVVNVPAANILRKQNKHVQKRIHESAHDDVVQTCARKAPKEENGGDAPHEAIEDYAVWHKQQDVDTNVYGRGWA